MAEITSMSKKPKISVIIPTYNSAQTLEECLSTIFETKHEDYEVVIVDDCSTDDSVSIARRFPCKIVRTPSNSGASAARNLGARTAEGDILLFIDSDIILPPQALLIIEKDLGEGDASISGVVGLLSSKTRSQNLCSQYKNLYMHYTYSKLPPHVCVFYTSIAAIRREIFEGCHGFNEHYRNATIEDIEFGERITSKGYVLYLDQGLAVEHIRYYSLKGLLKTAISRAFGITKIILRKRFSKKAKANYQTSPWTFIMGIALAYLATFFVLIGFFLKPFILIGVSFYLLLVLLNLGFLNFIRKAHGLKLFLGSIGLIFLDLLAHGWGNITGVLSYFSGKEY